MKVRVRLFARQREVVGSRQVDLDVTDGATIEGAWTALVATYPALAPGGGTVRFARNGEYASAEEQLSEGDELACIPPISGGEGAADRTVRRIGITDRPIDGAALLALQDSVATAADGAVVLFVGRTRETPGTPAPGEEEAAARHAGAAVLALEYEAYEDMARAVLERIAAEIEARFGVQRLALVHRTGSVPLGEASVAIAVAAPHREAAFEACRYAIDELKARAPIWKAERFADGSVWIGSPARTETPADR